MLGAYIDRVGRRQGLIVTLAMMALGTLTLALTPSYASIGVAAPIIILLGRLLQGFSAGAELGGVSVYLVRDRDARATAASTPPGRAAASRSPSSSRR